MALKEGYQVPMGKKIIYGSGEFFGGTATVIVLSIFHKFLVEFAGIEPFLAGVAVFAGRFWDAFTDPWFGMISDNTRSRFGRRRPFFLYFTIPASIAFIALWIPIGGDVMWVKVVYYALAYMIFSSFSTLLTTPWIALGSELTTNYNERTLLITIRMVFSILGSMFAGVVPNVLIQQYPEYGYLIMAVLLGIVYLVIWFSIFGTIKEPTHTEESRREPFFKAVVLALKNRSFRRLVGMYVCAFLAIDFVIASPRYFGEEYLQRPFLVQIMMVVIITCMMIGLPLYFVLTKKVGRKKAYMIGAIIWFAALTVVFFVPQDVAVLPFLIACAVLGLGMASAFVIPWSALPEVIDVDRCVNDRSVEGIYAGIMTFVRKLISSVVVLLIGATLSLAGYVSEIPPVIPAGDIAEITAELDREDSEFIIGVYSVPSDEGLLPREDLTQSEQVRALTVLKSVLYVEQPPSVLTAIRFNTSAFAALLLIVGLVFSFAYPITKRHHELMRKRLDKDPEHPLSAEEEQELDEFLKEAY